MKKRTRTLKQIAIELLEFLIINKAIARCSNDEFYTESDRRTMVLMGEAMKNFEQVEVADTPQTDCGWK